jgi:hypothetical protein
VPPPIAGPPPASAQGDITLVRPLIEELRGQLRRRGIRARKIVENLEQALPSDQAAELGPLREAIGKLDYQQAAGLLEDFVSRIAGAGAEVS